MKHPFADAVGEGAYGRPDCGGKARCGLISARAGRAAEAAAMAVGVVHPSAGRGVTGPAMPGGLDHLGLPIAEAVLGRTHERQVGQLHEGVTHEQGGLEVVAVLADLEMQVRAGGVAGRADVARDFASVTFSPALTAAGRTMWA